MPRRCSAVLSLALLGLLASGRLAGQDSDTRAPVERARALTEIGDTAGAIGLLRSALARHPDDGDALLALGTLLSRTAPTQETDFLQRKEAEELLNRAFRRRPDDAAVLVELAILLGKQGMEVDSRRLLERVLSPERVASLDPGRAADAHYALGRIFEAELDDFEYLVFLTPEFFQRGSDAGTRCPEGVTLNCYNYARPRDFNLQFLNAARASDRGVDDPPRIIEQYRAALSYEPTHGPASRALMAFLDRQGRVDDFRAVAEEQVRLNPGEPYGHLFLGLALYEDEEWVAAQESFDRGLALMGPEDRRPYESVTFLLDEEGTRRYAELDSMAIAEYERSLWARSDPLHLVPGNERRMEHVARVARAELNFGDPELGLAGWRSARGEVYIRYGEPEHIWMIAEGNPGKQAGGRTILWNYRLDAPSFIFTRTAGYRSTRFDLASNTALYVKELVETGAASVFRSRAVNRWVTIPTQIVRFRGSRPDLVEVVAFSTAPPDSFQLFAGDSVATAMYVFTANYGDSARLERTLSGAESGNLLYQLELPAGDWDYSIEALAAGSKVAGRERGSISVAPFRRVGLSASDLLVADALIPRVAEPHGWKDFSIAASRDLSFARGEPVHLYFEIYGLTPDFEGLSRYTLDLVVEDAERRGIGARVLRGLGSVLRGSEREPRVTFLRETEPRDRAASEYLSIALDDAEPGRYRIGIRVTEALTGQSVELSRDVTIQP